VSRRALAVLAVLAVLGALAACTSESADPIAPGAPLQDTGRDAIGELFLPVLASESISQVTSCDVPDVPPQDSLNVSIRQYYVANGQKLKMDVYWPKPQGWRGRTWTGPRPIVMIIHGGGWRSGSRTGFRDEARLLAGQGYVAATIDHREASAGVNTFPAAVEDVRCAVRYLRANAAGLNGDPTRLGVIGESSGGHVASMLGVAADVAGLDGSCPIAGSPAVDAVVSYYGPQDLRDAAILPNLQSEVTNFLGATPAQDPAKAALASPIVHVHAGAPPFLFLHRNVDNIVPTLHSQRMKAALEAVGVPATLVLLNEAGHGFAMFKERPKFLATSCTSLAFLAQELQP
jgi:acetyl esterase/lipase